jgi:hypothetical protein
MINTNHNLFKYFLIALLASSYISFELIPETDVQNTSPPIIDPLFPIDDGGLFLPNFNKRQIGYEVQSEEDFLENAFYCMKATHTMKVIGYVTEGDNQVFQYGYECSPKNSYQVIKNSNTGKYKLLNQETNKVLTEFGDYRKVRPVKLSNWKNSDNQLWEFSTFSPGQFQLFNKSSSNALDVEFESENDGTRLVTYDPNLIGTHQRFKFILNSIVKKKPLNPKKIGYRISTPDEFFDEGIYCFKNIKSSKVIGVYEQSNKVFQYGNDCSSNNFRFKVIQVRGTNDQFRIASMSGKGALTVTDVYNDKQPIVLKLWDNLDTQKWRFVYKLDEHKRMKEIQLRNVETNHTLDIWYGNMNDGAEVIAWIDNHNDPNERWNVTLVGIDAERPYWKEFDLPY